MEFKVKLQKATEETYLKASRLEASYYVNIFRSFEVRKKIRLIFLTWKHSINIKFYVLSAYNSRNKVSLVYVEWNLPEDGLIDK